MSTETYKAILKIAVVLISGSIFQSKDDSIDKYLPLYETLIEYLDVIDIMTQKLYLHDSKITYNTIKLVNDLILKALKFQYSGIITLAGRLKHVTLFSTIGNLIDTDDKSILDAISNLKISYAKLNDYLNDTKFDLSIKSHQIMLNNLFLYLEISLNEFGTPAKPEEYIKAGFTENPRKFIVDNATILLAMDLKIFLKDPNMTFKKKFHEELMMSDHNRTFPMYLFIEKATYLWIDVFSHKEKYPRIYDNILSWELMMYYTMNSCLTLWQETKAQLTNDEDVSRIMGLIKDNVYLIEENLTNHLSTKTIEECLDLTLNETNVELRRHQIDRIKGSFSDVWDARFTEFNKQLAFEVMEFVCEQRVIQLLKGSWAANGSVMAAKYYFILLSPNRQYLYYKEFTEKSLQKPSFEEMEQQSIKLTDITDLRSQKVGDHVGEEDKKKHSMLISVKGTISYEKITLIGANNKKLLSFYTDTQVNKYVWLDGLKMLKGIIKPGQLSSDTEKQLDALVDIRRNTQLMNLEDVKSVNQVTFRETSGSSSDDEDYYDINELTTVATDKYYYAV
ncbi:hypothetical protein CANTEDRAFT_108216 [Yamadazyma tenuis ATCC 10573]|uniref:PH domain-containing protein n=1 Tax=Candida tenuis (strain ATCC 10573 / BCRC 21748 / CBS 615 / JCM 9827 / NBRC 10315 / NRRL Y-1498 / VKM Y-70) TaxID=590646 RepID=G3BBH7_CANTC|nr:uncharacterized protein CANTEDRAFT_108216 [Yamadazyma tenuis ATCC 10573]EGV61540.1 hypothetical protein CANTEDRAFT_108216 [Yamadazyma tenuis ATCC 10573]